MGGQWRTQMQMRLWSLMRPKLQTQKQWQKKSLGSLKEDHLPSLEDHQ
jgi:hypothetical protein